MKVPGSTRDAIEQAVTECLADALSARGLLLTPAQSEEARSLAAENGKRLLTVMAHRCYPLSEYDTQVVTLEFESEGDWSRVQSALAFGATIAGLLTSPLQREPDPASVEVVSAIFNLGLGLVDGLCDENADIGLGLLHLIDLGNVDESARNPRPRGWLRAQLPGEWESDAGVSFTADIVETFFETLHATYPGERWAPVRSRIGEQLAVALEAERLSVSSSSATASHEQLIEYSYATSVLPFEIVGTLTDAAHAPVSAHLLGEAMWRIDDLVDLCDDLETGALNAVLLEAAGTGLTALQGLLASDDIARAAAQAGESVLRAVELADGRDRSAYRDGLLDFIARYAGLGRRGLS